MLGDIYYLMLGDIYYLMDNVSIVMMVGPGLVRPWQAPGKWGLKEFIDDGALGLGFNDGAQRAYLVMTRAEAMARIGLLNSLAPFDLNNDGEMNLATEREVLHRLWGSAARVLGVIERGGATQKLVEYDHTNGTTALRFVTTGWHKDFQQRVAGYWHLTDLWMKILAESGAQWSGVCKSGQVPSVQDMYRARQAVGHHAYDVKGKVKEWLSKNS